MDAWHIGYDNLKLEKGMYNEAGKSFTQVLEAADPSEYKGTPPGGAGRLPAPAQAL